MRDWSVWDPSYSENDATHPRNRPAGAGPADPVRVSAAVESATRRVLAAGVAASLATGRRAGPGTSMPGPAVSAGTPRAEMSQARLQAAWDSYTRMRNTVDLVDVAEARALAAARPGRFCPYW